MSSINVVNIVCKNPKDKFTSPFNFEIVFECLSELKNDIEWKLIYIGKADDTSFDQELESLLIGPLQIGQMKFDLDAEKPDDKKIPKEDLLGITAIILTCAYNNQEFFRVGYYVNNVYLDELPENNEEISVEKIERYILHDKPRITKFNISWDTETDLIPGYSSTHKDMFDGTYDPTKDLDEMKNLKN